MAIRNIAHSIRAGEISLGVAVGVESMSLKSVPVVWYSRRASGVTVRGSYLSRSRSPRPTPVVEDTVSADPQAHDCIQVRSLGAPLWVVVLDNDCALAAHGVDLRNGRSNVQHLSAEARRVRAHFSYACSKGLSLSLASFFVFPLEPAETDGNMSRRR
jgi:hypothetical protein